MTSRLIPVKFSYRSELAMVMQDAKKDATKPYFTFRCWTEAKKAENSFLVDHIIFVHSI